ncbi:MAG TPA: hypothetical protein VG367_07575 [Mucilaginibacter sp.]|jgi:hypothetical protein|nr:hypothetical protein [Mucilaginibacter sp.]
MPSTKPQDFYLLLEVFRGGLACGLISKEKAVAWADNIIKNESEPDYFFIELSLCPDTNAVAEVLDKYISGSKSPIPLRVIFGLTYQKLMVEVIDLDTAITFTERTPFHDILTSFEYGSIYEFEEYEMCYPTESGELKKAVFKFLSFYKDFNLTNYDQWIEINRQVEELLKVEQEKLDAINEEWRRIWKKNEAKRKLKRYIPIGILILVWLFIILLNFKMMRSEPTVSKLFDDHEYVYFLDFFVLYSTIRLAYKAWAIRRRMRQAKYR